MREACGWAQRGVHGAHACHFREEKMSEAQEKVSEFERIIEANQVFTPGAPVQTRDLFAGRSEQLNRATGAG
jgi:hypothetical protein